MRVEGSDRTLLCYCESHATACAAAHSTHDRYGLEIPSRRRIDRKSCFLLTLSVSVKRVRIRHQRTVPRFADRCEDAGQAVNRRGDSLRAFIMQGIANTSVLPVDLSQLWLAELGGWPTLLEIGNSRN